MIEEPPVLTVKKNTYQPSKVQLDALRDIPTGFLADALSGRGALCHSIKALAANGLPQRIYGVALTCYCGPNDVLAVFGALTEVSSGDVLIAATDQCTSSAVIGDRVMGMLHNAGGVGFVTDGLVRDLDGIRAVGLPVYCAGISPNSPHASGPGEIGTQVNLGGMVVNTGDIISGDEDGVVVVPYENIDEVIAASRKIRELEEDLDARVADGLIAPDHIVELMKSDRVRRI